MQSNGMLASLLEEHRVSSGRAYGGAPRSGGHAHRPCMPCMLRSFGATGLAMFSLLMLIKLLLGS